MPISYAVKRFFRSWNLFLALLLGITLASAFFAGIDIKANATASQALDQQLKTVYVDMQVSISSLNSTQMLAAQDSALNVDGVDDAEIISRIYWIPIRIFDENDSVGDYAEVAAITDDSHVYDGWINKPSEKIGVNETYILEGSELAGLVEKGDIIQINFTIYCSGGEQIVIPLNLTMTGFAQLDDAATAIASRYQQWIMPLTYAVEYPAYQTQRLLLISWERTMQKILETMQKYSTYSTVETNLLIYLNRKALINPWDIETSINNINVVKNSIVLAILNDLNFNANVQNNLEWPLRSFQLVSMMVRFSFTIVSLPIFFVAWYMGRTVSDVSFNLRRREIGLLSTKGFSRGQILRTFLTETLLIGCVGGILGAFLGFLLIPFFTQFSPDTWINPHLIRVHTL